MAKKIQPAVRELSYKVPVAGTTINYIDMAKDLSIVNRRLYEQGRQYFIGAVEWLFVLDTNVVDTVYVAVETAGDTWVVHNAHTKAKALWNEMNQLVLHDNPSIEGKWADYKVYLDDHMRTGTVLSPEGYTVGEWNYSDYVLPQHEVDPATGVPLAADQCQVHLVGPTVGAPGNFVSVGLVDAYQESRARVQIAPDVPAGMSQSFFNLLTDSGSQEPELADVIDAENDEPPYDIDNYPGGAINSPGTIFQEIGVASSTFPNGKLPGFSAECGLIKLSIAAYKDGVLVDLGGEDLIVKFSVMPGDYKGVAALPMGQ